MGYLYKNFSGHDNERGFTILEVVAVLIIIGIIVAAVISTSTTGDSYKVASEAQALKTYLRFAQARSMSDETTSGWGVKIESGGTSYTLQKDGATAPYFLPDETSATHQMQNGVTITGCTNCVNSTITFDKWGSPGNTTLSINLSAGGENSPPITVTRITGFIP